MTRLGSGALLAVALTAAVGLRTARVDERPMHHDEANQAVKFGDLLERGEYRYDYHDHHGPTLYYLTLPSAWLGGRHTFASLDEATLRRVPAFFGIVTILLLPLLSTGIGRTATVVAALLMALSPAMVFYSRMFIQEALFACFALAFVVAVGRIAAGGGRGWWMLAGVAAGLAAATKETSVIVLPAALMAGAIAWWSLSSDELPDAGVHARGRAPAAISVGIAIVIAATFYTSLFTAPAALLEPFRGAPTYVTRGIEPVNHAHPWYYYVRLLGYTSAGGARWSEGLVLVLAVTGAASGWCTRPDTPGARARLFWARYLTCYVAIAGAVLSAIPYKTPWNVLPFYVAAFPLAGIGFATLIEVVRARATRAVFAVALAIGAWQLGSQAWRASIIYAADPRNPYVYAQTVPDAVRMAARIRDLAALDARGARMQVSVIAPAYEQWPLPWYLRTMPNVGYWTTPGDPVALQAPVIVSSIEHMPALDSALGERYVSEFYGLRPDVLQALYVERGLWDRFLAHAK